MPGGGGGAKAEQREMAGCAHVLKGEQDLAARLSFSRGEGSANRAQGAVCRDELQNYSQQQRQLSMATGTLSLRRRMYI